LVVESVAEGVLVIRRKPLGGGAHPST
jgi:hypothetical protein